MRSVQFRVIRITDGDVGKSVAVEGFRPRGVQRCVQQQPPGEIGVGDEVDPECRCIGLALRDQALGVVAGEFFVGDENTPELRLDLRAESRRTS